MLGGAIDSLGAIGRENVFRHETELVGYVLAKSHAIDEITVYTPAER